jgi:hypothetical protein
LATNAFLAQWLTQDYLDVMKALPLPELLAQVWSRAEPDRKAAAVNELLRSLRELCADDEGTTITGCDPQSIDVALTA